MFLDKDLPPKGLIICGECGSIMTPSYTKKNKNNGGSKYIYYYRCTKTYQYNWNTCPIKIVNAEKIENYVIEKLKEISQNNQIIINTNDKINLDEENRIIDYLETEKKLKNELSNIEKQIKNIVGTLAEGGIKFKQIKSKLEELENKRKLLDAEIEEIKIKVKNEKLIKYDSKLVIDSLKEIAKQIEEAKADEQKRLLQLTIKEIKYGRQNILINLFYLPAVNSGSKNRSELLPVLNKFRTIPIKVENTIIITCRATQSPKPDTDKPYYKKNITKRKIARRQSLSHSDRTRSQKTAGMGARRSAPIPAGENPSARPPERPFQHLLVIIRDVYFSSTTVFIPSLTYYPTPAGAGAVSPGSNTLNKLNP